MELLHSRSRIIQIMPSMTITTMESGTSVKEYYYLFNGQSDVVQIINRDGNPVNTYRYDEWGNIIEQQEQISNSIKYVGEQYDNETGLYYLKSLYYDPVMGRFLSKDTFEGTITNQMTLNVYTYAYNNPVMYIDPTGHLALWQIDNLLSGIAMSGKDTLQDLLKTPGALYELVFGIMKGKISFTDIASSMGASLSGPFEYLYKNTKKVFAGNPSDAEVYEYGRQLGNVLQMALGSSVAIKFVSKALPKLGKLLNKISSKEIDLPCNYYIRGTQIKTDEGEKSIEDITVGDKVLS